MPTLVQWDNQVGLVGPEQTLWVEAEQSWMEGLIRQLEPLDPLSAPEIAEQALLEKLVENAGSRLWAFLDDVNMLLTHGEMALETAQASRRYDRVATLAQWLDRLDKVQKSGEALAELWGAFSGKKRSMPAKHPSKKAPVPDKTRKRTKGAALPQKEYRLPILRALAELGGRGKTAEVLDRVYLQLKHLFTDGDLERAYDDPRRDEPIWRNRARWEIAALKEEKLVQSGGYGVLILTDKGAAYLHGA